MEVRLRVFDLSRAQGPSPIPDLVILSRLSRCSGLDGMTGSTLGLTSTMKRSKFTEEQIAYALRQAESGTPVPDV